MIKINILYLLYYIMENKFNKKYNNKLVIPDDMSIDISTDNILNYSDLATSDTDNLTEELSSILGCFTSQQIKKEEESETTNIDSDFVLKTNENKQINKPDTNNIKIENNNTTTQTKIHSDVDTQMEQTKNNILELKIDIYQVLQLVNGLKEKILNLENEINMIKTAVPETRDIKPSNEILGKISELEIKIETNEKNNFENKSELDKKINDIFNNISNDVLDNKIDNVKKYIDEKISNLQIRFSSTKKFMMNKNKNL